MLTGSDRNAGRTRQESCSADKAQVMARTGHGQNTSLDYAVNLWAKHLLIEAVCSRTSMNNVQRMKETADCFMLHAGCLTFPADFLY